MFVYSKVGDHLVDYIKGVMEDQKVLVGSMPHLIFLIFHAKLLLVVE